MCDIPVSNLINIGEPNNFKLHAARHNGKEQPLDVYVRNKEEWLGWNRWRRGTNEFSRRYIFSLIDFYPESGIEFRQLTPIFNNENSDWKTALENMKGVYVVMDRSNGKKYIGSAYGGSGIWSRWSDYIGTAHGGNDDLVKLIKKEGPEYANQNFVLSLLEYRPMKTDDDVIFKRESYWKKVFLSGGKFGYNKN